MDVQLLGEVVKTQKYLHCCIMCLLSIVPLPYSLSESQVHYPGYIRPYRELRGRLIYPKL